MAYKSARMAIAYSTALLMVEWGDFSIARRCDLVRRVPMNKTNRTSVMLNPRVLIEGNLK
jgi:hypothetical protein